MSVLVLVVLLRKVHSWISQ